MAAELAACGTSLAGLTYENLGKTGKLYPCPDPEGSDGTVVMYDDEHPFPTPSGRGKFVPAEVVPPAELPDAEYPFVLNTGRLLEHWHGGSMTRRAKALDEIEPEAFASIHPEPVGTATTRCPRSNPPARSSSRTASAARAGGSGAESTPT